MIRRDFNKNWEYGISKSDVNTLLSGTSVDMQKINLPHDAMLYSERRPDSVLGPDCAFFIPESYDYIKSFFAPKDWKNKVIYLEFEGAYMNAYVFVNNVYADHHPYGYSNFYVKIDDLLRYDSENTIRVTLKYPKQPNTRWYSGAGLYRNVKLILGNTLHIGIDGVKITTPDIEKDSAVIAISTEIEHDGKSHQEGWLLSTIKDSSGKKVGEESTKFSIGSNEKIKVEQRIYLKNPSLWDIESPILYTCESKILIEEKVIDECINTFGIRKLQLDNLHGLRINGKTVKLKGGCIHHDNGLLGAATFEDAEERRIRLLKNAGYNAIRSSHNPMSKAMLNACDKLGMLVVDEFADSWTHGKVENDYASYFPDWWEQDIELMVNKDFNHPCVIMYSIGNEIPETGSPYSSIWSRRLAEKIRSIDNTRFITCGINVMFSILTNVDEISFSIGDLNTIQDKSFQTMNEVDTLMSLIVKHPITGKAIEETCGVLDIVGYNYAAERYDIDHKDFPNRIFVGSETTISDLDVNWELVKNREYVIGDFCWTAWDYLGEAGIGRIVYEGDEDAFLRAEYPWIAAYCSDFDLVGYRRPISYWREIVWGKSNHQPYIAVQNPKYYGKKQIMGRWTDSISSWTWPGYEGKKIVVEVYSDAEEIELCINNRSLGKKLVKDEFKKFYCKWDTTYEPGIIEAIAYAKGKEVGRYCLKTAGEPKLRVTKESNILRSGSNDLCFINIELVDKNGILNTSCDRLIHLCVEGPAIIQGSGSANPRTEERYYETSHKTFYGRMLAILRATDEKGMARLIVASDGLNEVIVEIPVI